MNGGKDSDNGGPEDFGRFDWDDLRVLLAVAESGSFSGAARVLGVGQPAISKRIDQLESRLGTTLCIRRTDGVGLTEEGEMVADYALTMRRSAQALDRMVSFRDKEVAGSVCIRCPDGLATFWVAPFLRDFQRAYPDIQIELRTGAAPEQNFKTAADLTIQFEETKRLDDVAVPLCFTHYMPFAAAEYLALFGTPTNVLELLSHKAILHTDYRHQIESWAAKTKSMQDMADPALTTDCGPAMLTAAASGAGIAVVPTYVAVLDPRLTAIGNGALARAQVWLVFNRERGAIARCRKTIDWLKSVFLPKDNPWFREEFIHPNEFGPRHHPWATR